MEPPWRTTGTLSFDNHTSVSNDSTPYWMALSTAGKVFWNISRFTPLWDSTKVGCLEKTSWGCRTILSLLIEEIKVWIWVGIMTFFYSKKFFIKFKNLEERKYYYISNYYIKIFNF